jgi:predicted transcriptional regulator
MSDVDVLTLDEEIILTMTRDEFYTMAILWKDAIPMAVADLRDNLLSQHRLIRSYNDVEVVVASLLEKKAIAVLQGFKPERESDFYVPLYTLEQYFTDYVGGCDIKKILRDCGKKPTIRERFSSIFRPKRSIFPPKEDEEKDE